MSLKLMSGLLVSMHLVIFFLSSSIYLEGKSSWINWTYSLEYIEFAQMTSDTDLKFLKELVSLSPYVLSLFESISDFESDGELNIRCWISAANFPRFSWSEFRMSRNPPLCLTYKDFKHVYNILLLIIGRYFICGVGFSLDGLLDFFFRLAEPASSSMFDPTADATFAVSRIDFPSCWVAAGFLFV